MAQDSSNTVLTSLPKISGTRPTITKRSADFPERKNEMLTFTVSNSRTFFQGSEEELEKVHECLRVENAQAHWQAMAIAKRSCGWDRNALLATAAKIEKGLKYLKFYNGNSFGTGLCRHVKKYLDSQKIKVRWEFPDQEDIEYELTWRTFKAPRLHSGITLRQEQILAVYTALRNQRGILHMATNFGKTECAAAIIRWLFDHLKRVPNTLFLVHRKGLAEQTANRFEEHLRVKVGLLGGGRRELETVTVATTQTITRLLHTPRMQEFLASREVLFIDELHVNKADMAQTISDHCEASIRIGLSGTVSRRPERLFPLVGMTGPIIGEVRNKELVEKGHSAKPLIRIVRINAAQAGQVFGSTYAENYNAAIVTNEFRNGKIVEEVKQYTDRNLRTLVTIQRLEHGRILQEMFADQEIEARFLWGEIPLPERKENKDAFVARKFTVLIVSSIFDLGEDLPEIEAWVNAAGGKGWELVLQRLGRVLRRKEGENKVYVSDFSDEHNAMLKQHSRARLGYYLKEDIAEIEVIQ